MKLKLQRILELTHLLATYVQYTVHVTDSKCSKAEMHPTVYFGCSASSAESADFSLSLSSVLSVSSLQTFKPNQKYVLFCSENYTHLYNQR